MTHRPILLTTLSFLLAMLGAGGLVHAALALPDAPAGLIAVTTLSDQFGPDFDVCSLREAIQTANGNSTFGGCSGAGGSETIQLGAGNHILSFQGANDDTNAIGDLDVTTSMTIVGAGPLSTTISVASGFGDRVLHIGPGATLVMSGVRLFGAAQNVTQQGAVIQVQGVLRLSNCVVANGQTSLTGGGLAIEVGGALIMDDCVVENNTAATGGGIRNQGVATITHSVIAGNDASGSSQAHAGGIATSSNGVLTLASSVVSGNSATQYAGGLDIKGERATIIDSTISGNSAPDSGGILLSAGSLLMRNSALISNTATSAAGMRITNTLATLINSTVSGNVAQAGAGGVAINTANGRLYLFNTTIANNTTDVLNNGSNGGGLSIQAGSHVSMTNSVLADNIDSGASNDSPDCFGAIHSEGYNHIESMANCTVSGNTTGNVTGSDPGLGGLKNNGGPTLSHMPNAGSSVIDSGDPAGCEDPAGGVLTTDQRGFFRPVNGGITSRCDKGSIERLSYLTRVMLPLIVR
ncbi:MAG: choice-of-anchor Q domain-containing protein [Thermoflexales bacterium]